MFISESSVLFADYDGLYDLTSGAIAVLLVSCSAVASVALWPSPVQPIAIAAVFYSAAHGIVKTMDDDIVRQRRQEMKHILFAPAGIVRNYIVTFSRSLNSLQALSVFLGAAIFFVFGPAPNGPLHLLPNSHPSNVDWLALAISLVVLLIPLQMVRLLFNFSRRQYETSFDEQQVWDESARATRDDPSLDALTEPYSLLACTVFAASFIATAYLEARGLVACTFENVLPTTAVFAIPAMSLSTVVLAALRGEFKDLWCYVHIENNVAEDVQRLGHGFSGYRDEEEDLISMED